MTDADATADDSPPKPFSTPIDGFWVVLGTPRRLPKPAKLRGRVVVVDIAFAAEGGGRSNAFEKTTLRFIERLDERLAMWVDHHDSKHHSRFRADPRFVLATKRQHGACPEMVEPAIVKRAGVVDTIVCHNDFDGLASAAKWIRGGTEPYQGCDADARAIDTRIGEPSLLACRMDRALRARPRDGAIREIIVRLLVAGGADGGLLDRVDEAGLGMFEREAVAQKLAKRYRALSDDLALADVTDVQDAYDKTTLLLAGQQRWRMVVLVDGETVTFAAPFDSGVDFLTRFGLSGGMPTLVSLFRNRLRAALLSLDVAVARVDEVAPASDLQSPS